MRRLFDVAAGSVTGRDHLAAGRNNQDAFSFWSGDEGLVAVVSDGCGSGRHSEVGARLGVRLFVEALRARLTDAGGDARALVEAAAVEVLSRLGPIAAGMGGDLSEVVADHFLFTLLGVVATREETALFLAGDGVTCVNDGPPEVRSCPGNAPPYLGYGMLDAFEPPAVVTRMPTRDVASLVLGTDGAAALVEAAGRPMPGRPESVAPLHELATRDLLFRNPAALSRWLVLCGRDGARAASAGARAPGLLSDDTTLLLLRRPPEA